MRPLLAYLRWRWALLRFFLADDFYKIAGDPSLGDSREDRNRNIKLMMERREQRRPQRKDFT